MDIWRGKILVRDTELAASNNTNEAADIVAIMERFGNLLKC